MKRYFNQNPWHTAKNIADDFHSLASHIAELENEIWPWDELEMRLQDVEHSVKFLEKLMNGNRDKLDKIILQLSKWTKKK